MLPSSSTDIVGLPANYVPVVRSFYDLSLFSFDKPTSITCHEAEVGGWDFDRKVLHPDPLALLLTCHQTRDEAQDYLRILLNRGSGPSQQPLRLRPLPLRNHRPRGPATRTPRA